MDAVTRRTNAFVKALSSAIRKRRKEAGLSQNELAARAGISHQYVGYIERQERTPTVDTLFRLALALGCSPGDLCGDAEGQERPSK